MNIFLLLMLFSTLYSSKALPSCCLDPLYYSDLLLPFSCNLTCSLKYVHSEDSCVSCVTRVIDTQNNSSESEEFTFSKPTVLCQTLSWKKNDIFGKVLLKWSSLYNITPSIFIIEVRNSSLSTWNFVGMANETVAYINDLDVNCEYQFRVTPFVIPNLKLSPLYSDWNMVFGTQRSLSAPLNLTISSFRVHDRFVEATVEWNASTDVPCSYVLYWFPTNFDGSLFEKTVALPSIKLSTVLEGLNYRTKYNLKVAALDLSSSRQVDFAKLSFTTPSCLTLTEGNFSLCAPGPPLNFTVLTLSDSEVFLSWMPPNHTSIYNQVSGYQISVIEASEKHYIHLRPKESFSVPKSVLNTTISNLRSAVLYLFHVRAFTIDKIGPPAVAYSETTALSVSYQPLDYVPWHYIVPSLVFALIIILIAVFCQFIRSKKKKANYKGTPSGTADVPDHILPSLLQSSAIELQEVIGKGEFGVVHKGFFCRNKEKETVAVKVFPAESISRSKLLQEVDVLLTVGRHRNVVNLIGFTMDIDRMFLVLEFCALGNLYDRLKKLKRELTVIKRQKSDPKQPLIDKGTDKKFGIQLCSYVHQIALGMDHISSLRMIHRDLAARNILLCSEKHVKIADFGLSRDVYETQSYTVSRQKKLPLRWMAPESIAKHIFTTQTDVWSFGVLVWEIFRFGKVPYESLCNSTILPYLQSGYRLPKPHATSQEWYDLMLRCWHIDPKKRPSFKELVQKTETFLGTLCHYDVVVSD